MAILYTVTAICIFMLSSTINCASRSCSEATKKIHKFVMNGNARGESYRRMARFCDKYPGRLAGTETIERSIDYAVEQLISDGFENVRKESFNFRSWIRIKEEAMLISSEVKNRSIAVSGCGYSASTPNQEAVEANVTYYLTKNFNRCNEFRGRIVLAHFLSPRLYKMLAKCEATAILGLSTFLESLYTLHTGVFAAVEEIINMTAIPTARITQEDFYMLNRLFIRNISYTIRLNLQFEEDAEAVSHNIIAEISGTDEDKRNETVVVGGHIDSWDNSQGAMDDAGGMYIMWEGLRVLLKLGLRPLRTLRLVIWSAEELGLQGSNDYFRKYRHEINTTSVIMESDSGAFKPIGLCYRGNTAGMKIMQNIVTNFKKIKADTLFLNCTSEPDIAIWNKEGVPEASPAVDGYHKNSRKYWKLHHTAADTVDKLKAPDMNKLVVLIAGVSYCVGNLPELLPRYDLPDLPKTSTTQTTQVTYEIIPDVSQKPVCCSPQRVYNLQIFFVTMFIIYLSKK